MTSVALFMERQRGQALAEYIYVFPILIMLIMGAIQFGFIYQAKTTLNYATFAATRAGALQNGSMAAIVDGLTAGMMPMFAHNERNGGNRDLSLLKDAWKLASSQVGNATLTQITIVNPTSVALSTYQAQSELGNEIPNDNLMYRSTNVVGGGMSLQDANLLKVRVVYCYKMAVPIINRMIHSLLVDSSLAEITGSTGADIMATSDPATSSQRCANIPDEYRIPVIAEAVVRMQSPFRNPGKWVGP